MDTTLSADARAQLVLDNSTLSQTMRWLNEQASTLPNQTSWSGGVTYEAALPCTPTVYYTDGPENVRHNGSTTFPGQLAVASTWDQTLAYAKGLAMGDESYQLGYNGVLAPGVASGRTPLSGRTPEYLGEDSLLSGLMAGQQILGLQANPVITSLKHYVANEQELRRNSSSSNLSERALYEVYNLPFEIAIDVGDPSSIMCSYNQINGTYACENSILNEVLKEEVGYEGFIMSDFGAVHSTVASLVNGLDLELNRPSYFSPANLTAALTAGTITVDQINNAAFRVVRAYIKAGLFDTPLTNPGHSVINVSTAENKAVARSIVEEGTVLLKNADAALPLADESLSVAVIGSVAASPTETTATPNARTNCSQTTSPPCTDLISPLTSIKQRVEAAGGTVWFSSGTNAAAAAELAAQVDVAIVFGYTRMGEFSDATSLNLAGIGNELITAVAAAADKTIVVLETGSAVVMPWLASVDAVLEAWYPGEQVGPALAALLWGDVSPSGKLPMTFPVSLAQSMTQTTEQYPGLNPNTGAACTSSGSTPICQVNYTEDLAVGYKWYDETGTAPLFAFGHGLTYTTFEYSNLAVVPVSPDETGAALQVSFDLENTGSATATEVPQVYVTLPESSDTPGKRLVSFERVTLEPGQSTHVTALIDSNGSDHPLSVWDADADEWVLVEGDATIQVGAASNDIRLTSAIAVEETIVLDFTVETDVRCVARKAVLAVNALHAEDVPVAFEIVSDFASKSFAPVVPGKSATHTFTTRLATLPAGTVTVTATADIGDTVVTTERVIPYAETLCG
jgi:beta-glucosidase